MWAYYGGITNAALVIWIESRGATMSEQKSNVLDVGDLAPAFSARPVFGVEVAVPPQTHPLALFFVRHLGCPLCRKTLMEIQERFADFDRMGVKVAAVTQTSLPDAQDFVPRHHMLFPIVADEDGRLRAQFGVGQDRLMLGTVRRLSVSSLRRVGSSLSMGHSLGVGPERQLAAEFVIRPTGEVAYAKYGCSVTHGPDLEAMLECAMA